MTSGENKAVVQRFFEESDRRREMAEELLGPDFTLRFPGAPPMGAATFKQHLVAFYAAFTDVHGDIEEVLAEGDKVAIRRVSRGIHTGEYMGAPASGKQIAVTNTVIAQVVGGRITEWWPAFDALGLMRQIGALPAPAEAASA